MTDDYLSQISDPETGDCKGYHIVIRMAKPFFYRGKWRNEVHYFGSCRGDRIRERIEEQLNPQIVETDQAYTIRKLPDGKEYTYKQSNWIFGAIHRYGGVPELVEVVNLNTTDLSEAGKKWDRRQSETYESLGILAYGK